METGQHNAAIAGNSFRVAQCTKCSRLYQQDGNDPCPFCDRADLLEQRAKLKNENRRLFDSSGRLRSESIRADYEIKELIASRDHVQYQLSQANTIICDIAAALGETHFDRNTLADKVRALNASVLHDPTKLKRELRKQCTRVERLQQDLRQMNATMVQISNLALTETKTHSDHWQAPKPDYEDISKMMTDVPIITNDEVKDDGD